MPHIFTNAEYADMLYAVLTRVAKYIEVDGSHIIQMFGSKMAVRLSVLCTDRLTALYTQENSWFSFLLEAESTPGT
jgi:hypothetical protein